MDPILDPEAERIATSSPRPLSLRRKIAFACVPAVLLLLVAELAARLTEPAGEAAVHREHERLIDVLGLPALNATMEFDPELFWKLRPELRGLRVAGKLRDSEFDFRVTTHAGLRSPPVSPEKKGLRVLALGDSCTFGLGVDDDVTWPAQLERRLRTAGVEAEVINAGVPGYTAFQGARFFERRGLELQPDWVVVSFGFNDRDLWSSRSDRETARELESRRWTTALLRSRLYARLRGWLRGAPFSDENGSGGEASRPADSLREAKPRLEAWEFLAALEKIRELAQSRDIRLVYVAWPYRSQVRERIHEFVHYQAILAQAAQRAHIPIVHLATRFIDRGGALFLDHVHASGEGNRVASEAIAEVILGGVRSR